MSKVRETKKQLADKYGQVCLIDLLKLREEKPTLRLKREDGKMYTGKCQYRKMKELTYHHILEKCKGGQVTLDNGGNLIAPNHQWFNTKPKKEQNAMNSEFKRYKHLVDIGAIVVRDNVIISHGLITNRPDEDYIEIMLEDNTTIKRKEKEID